MVNDGDKGRHCAVAIKGDQGGMLTRIKTPASLFLKDIMRTMIHIQPEEPGTITGSG